MIQFDEWKSHMYSILEVVPYNGDEVEKKLQYVYNRIPKSEGKAVTVTVHTGSKLPMNQRKNEFVHPNQKTRTTEGWEKAFEISVDPKVITRFQDLRDMITMKLGAPYATNLTILYRKGAAAGDNRMEMVDSDEKMHQNTAVVPVAS